MRRLLALLGGLALLRAWLARRRHPVPAEEPEAELDPRAEELRRRLHESRGLADERDEFEAGETPVDAAEPAEPEARRRDVHTRGRAAIDEMRGAGKGDDGE